MKLYCQVEGCQAVLEAGTNVTYSCREHTEKGEDKERFQDYQFDPAIGGTDPKAYERGVGSFKSYNRYTLKFKNISKLKKRNDFKIDLELASHENKDEILKILQQDIRDSNSGI